MNKETPTSVPLDTQEQLNSLKARVLALETWLTWFKSYLLTHPGGVTLLAVQPPGEGE